MSEEGRSWVDAFDRVPVRYSPPNARAEPERSRATIPLAAHRRRVRRKRVMALALAFAHRVLVVVAGWKARYTLRTR